MGSTAGGSLDCSTIKNEDGIRHGFTSELFHNHLIRTDAGGVQIYGKGIEGLYIDPGKTSSCGFKSTGRVTMNFSVISIPICKESCCSFT